MAKTPTKRSFATGQHVEIGAPVYLKRLTGWRYWWAKLRGKPTTIGVPASQVKDVSVFGDPESMKFLLIITSPPTFEAVDGLKIEIKSVDE